MSEAFPSAPKLDPLYDFELVVFMVENTLFRVLKQAFTAPGTAFEDKFLEANQLGADAGSAPGQRLDNPIVLTDADEKSFRAFLRVLYPFMWQGPVEAYEDWLGVLRLATLWKFDQIRKRAIEALEAHSTFTLPPGSDAEPKNVVKASLLKLQVGREYHIRQWVTNALCSLLEFQRLSYQDFITPPFNLG
ncbi:hypothetical protein D9619_002113 [Psilocybe cf. subviscida]|uniref:BTB domain-containing protein n=1 Tax=Psilocybe cf. subviscida TaxID=2480587 RepID=A0A8H5F287_9AGAR|nr:hypothetical protein D9619_002113 [Psilocybe cf. subviscida]